VVNIDNNNSRTNNNDIEHSNNDIEHNNNDRAQPTMLYNKQRQ